MPFVKGQRANPEGRPKGIKNNNKKPIKERLEGLLEKALPVIEEELENGTPEVKRELFIGLAGLVFSSKKTTDIFNQQNPNG